ncbi:1,2-phenylacetyl-CoA epoxidase subunit PaaD [Variovorax sp. VNK109]|uniref:1,2-phenylacetyl-CoA epoxidase subunit PaaD n=1 Tax=Variovorax sp. VNK109 TaxID=3400919 RepID=UPI003C0F7BF8
MVSGALEARIHTALDGVYDPEIPVVSIRELGILRDVRISGDTLEVVITPTYSGCPAMEQIGDDIRNALAREHVQVRVVTQLAPAWTTDWITPAARDKLRGYGIAPPSHAAAQPEGLHACGKVLQFRRPTATPPVPCPLCGSDDTTETSHFGSTACKALYRCLACMEPFDHFKPY